MLGLRALIFVLVSLASASSAPADVICKLHIRGFKNSSGVASASFQCQGRATVTAAADPLLLPFVKASPGVRLISSCVKDETFKTTQQHKCLLQICHSPALNVTGAHLASINMGSSEVPWALVCVLDGTVRFIKATLEGSDTGGIVAQGNSTVELVDSIIRHHHCSLPPGVDNKDWPMVVTASDTSTVLMESCNVYNNVRQCTAGTIGALSRATLLVSNSHFQDNSVKCSGCFGGALAVRDLAFGELPQVLFTAHAKGHFLSKLRERTNDRAQLHVSCLKKWPTNAVRLSDMLAVWFTIAKHAATCGNTV